MDDLLELLYDLMLIFQILIPAINRLLVIIHTTLITINKYVIKMRWVLEEVWRIKVDRYSKVILYNVKN